MATNNIATYEIFYSPSQNTLKVKIDGVTLSNTPVLGVVRVTDQTTVLHYNELGYMGDILKLGDGTTQFSSLPVLNSTTVVNNLTSTSETAALSASQGKVLNESKINISDIANNLTTDSETKVLSAKQGKELNTKIESATTKINTLTNNAVVVTDIVDDLVSTDTDKPLSANQGYVLNNKRATNSEFGFAKAGTNINSSNGELSVNSASTSQAGVVQLSDSVSTNSSTEAATSKAVKDAYDAATTVFIGATSSVDGEAGNVPAPTTSDKDKYLKGDGSWAEIITSNATTTEDGFMSKEDKIKLDSIDNNANNYSLPTASSSTLGGVKIGDNINISNEVISVNTASTSQSGVVILSDSVSSNSSTTAATSKAVKDAYDAATNVFTGATELENGGSGIVPSPTAGDQDTKFLKADGTWSVPQDTTYNTATQSVEGLLSAADKAKLDGIDTNANYIIIDSSMSDISENPVQNKIVKSYIDTEVANLVNSAPATLDTLQELAAALGDDPNFATTMATDLGNKVDKVTGKQLSTNDFTDSLKTKLENITDSADSVSITRVLSSGTKIATVTINGTDTDIYSTNDTTYNIVSASTNNVGGSDGLMLATDKEKLDGIASGANNYVHPTYTTIVGKPTSDVTITLGTTFTISQIISDTSGHISGSNDIDVTIKHPAYTATTGVEVANQTPAFGESFNISQVTSDATGHISSQTTRTVTIPNTVMTGATSSEDGTIGLVPAPIAGDSTRYLRSDGTWVTPPNDDTTYSAATASVLGLVKIGDNITNSSGTISVLKNNVLDALEYDSLETGSYYLKKDGTWAKVQGGGSGSIEDNITLYVSTSGNDSTGTGAISNPFLTLSRAYEDLPDFCKTVTIYIDNGTYSDELSEIVMYKDIVTLNIIASNASPDVTISISNSDTRESIFNVINAKKLVLKNINFTRNNNSTAETSILNLSSITFKISDCSFDGAYFGVNATSCIGEFNRCSFTNMHAALQASGASHILCNKNISSLCEYAIICNGSYVINFSSAFVGTLTNHYITQYGRVITGTTTEESGRRQSAYESDTNEVKATAYAFVARDMDVDNKIYDSSSNEVADTAPSTYGLAYLAPDSDTNYSSSVTSLGAYALVSNNT